MFAFGGAPACSIIGSIRTEGSGFTLCPAEDRDTNYMFLPRGLCSHPFSCQKCPGLQTWVFHRAISALRHFSLDLTAFRDRAIHICPENCTSASVASLSKDARMQGSHWSDPMAVCPLVLGGLALSFSGAGSVNIAFLFDQTTY